jgi:endonuclease YncB( thermonuclease family)
MIFRNVILKFILLAFLIISVLILNHAWSGETIYGKVVSIADGDTITVLDSSKTQHKIRLWGIDCPESHQDFGTKAKQFTSDLVFGKTVQAITEDTDRYGRTVGTVMIDGKSLNEELVKSGYAWVYGQYCKKPIYEQWKRYEETARTGKVGLWSQANPMPPWEFRHGSTKTAPTPSTITTQSAGIYHGNTRSQVFHASNCKDYNCKNCTVVFSDKDSAIKAGYRPCGMCKP